MNNNYIKKIVFIFFFIVIILNILIKINLNYSIFNYRVMVVTELQSQKNLKENSFIILKCNLNNYNEDDLVYVIKEKTNYIHRIKKIDNGLYITKGDKNFNLDTIAISSKDILGKVLFSIPYVGLLIKYRFLIISICALYLIYIYYNNYIIIKNNKRRKIKKEYIKR